jgi:PEP-CTERM motif
MRPLVALAALLLALAPAAARAATLTVSWTGHVTSVDSPLTSTFTVGDPASGSFQIETTTPDSDPAANHGEYNALVNMSVTLSGITATSAAPTLGGLSIFDSTPGTFVDGLEQDAGPWDGADLGSLAFFSANGLNLEDQQSTAFITDAIPTSLDLSQFEIRNFGLNYLDGEFLVQARAFADSITFIVPEPGALALLALGGAALAARRRP